MFKRWRVARLLHNHGIHALCREVVEREPLVPASLRLPDGTIWTPKLNGVGPTIARRYHS